VASPAPESGLALDPRWLQAAMAVGLKWW